MDDVIVRAMAAVAGHPAVIGVEFAGSRSRGTHTEHSDWDFAVQTDDFDALAGDLPALVETLDPLAAQWEPLGDFPVYMVLVPGPTKIEYLFLDRSQVARPPVTPGADTLVAIDAHFWDWVWWLATKASVGRSDLVARHLPQLHAHILRPPRQHPYHVQRRRVRPMGILDHRDRGAMRCQRSLQCPGERTAVGADRLQYGRRPRGSRELVHRAERFRYGQRLAAPDVEREVGTAAQLAQERRLPDSCLPTDQHHGAAAATDPLDDCQQPLDFCSALEQLIHRPDRKPPTERHADTALWRLRTART